MANELTAALTLEFTENHFRNAGLILARAEGITLDEWLSRDADGYVDAMERADAIIGERAPMEEQPNGGWLCGDYEVRRPTMRDMVALGEQANRRIAEIRLVQRLTGQPEKAVLAMPMPAYLAITDAVEGVAQGAGGNFRGAAGAAGGVGRDDAVGDPAQV